MKVDEKVEIATTPHGDVGHVLIAGEPLCPKNLHAEYQPVDDLPENGLCDNCKRIGKMTGLVEL